MFGILRTILAIYVVLLHIFSIPTLGNYAVTFFFVLSGFLMTYIMQNTYNYNFNGVKLFWINRFLRLYPAYWIVLILSLVVICFVEPSILNKSMFFPSNVKEWFSNISMIYFDIVPHRVKPRVVPTSWALTNELVFYLLISLGISKTFSRTFIWLIISVSYYVLTYCFYDLDTFRYSAIPAASLPFAMGSILYWLQYKIKSKISNIKWIIIGLGSFLLFHINAIYFTEIKGFNDFPIYFNLIVSCFTVYAFYNLKVSKKMFKQDQFIGNFSYPIYLIHYFVSFLYLMVFNFGIIPDSFKLEAKAIPLFFALLLVCCYPLTILDQKINLLKNNFKR